MTLQVSLDALVHDSKLWQETSDVLEDQKVKVAGLSLGEEEFSSWCTWFTDVESSYGDMRWHVYDILYAGYVETGKVADTLLEVKKAYEDTDTSARDAYDGLWEFVE